MPSEEQETKRIQHERMSSWFDDTTEDGVSNNNINAGGGSDEIQPFAKDSFDEAESGQRPSSLSASVHARLVGSVSVDKDSFRSNRSVPRLNFEELPSEKDGPPQKKVGNALGHMALCDMHFDT